MHPSMAVAASPVATLGVGAASAVGRVTRAGLHRMPLRHWLMLALALEVLAFGVSRAGSYRPPGILVDQTLVAHHVIT